MREGEVWRVSGGLALDESRGVSVGVGRFRVHVYACGRAGGCLLGCARRRRPGVRHHVDGVMVENRLGLAVEAVVDVFDRISRAIAWHGRVEMLRPITVGGSASVGAQDLARIHCRGNILRVLDALADGGATGICSRVLDAVGELVCILSEWCFSRLDLLNQRPSGGRKNAWEAAKDENTLKNMHGWSLPAFLQLEHGCPPPGSPLHRILRLRQRPHCRA